MDLYQGRTELAAKWNGAVKWDGTGSLRVTNETALRGAATDELVYNAVFNKDPATVAVARSLIRGAAAALGVRTESIKKLYDARGRGEIGGFTVPAINIRGLTYDIARAAFRVAKRTDAAAMVFELARSENGYTFQRPGEHASCVLAAAIREEFEGPLFLQGDHYQVNAAKFADAKAKEPELQAIRDLIVEAIAAGVYNIDIDSSTLVDPSKPTVEEQQRNNYAVCAHFTRFIRERQPASVTISIGGEVGEVGTTNSTVEDLDEFMAGYRRALGGNVDGLSKIAVQTGTSHGGIPLAGGGVAPVELDFKTLEDLSRVAREKYALAGAVQHGASTLPTALFNRFPEIETAEIHLATQFQNIVFDHPTFPAGLREKMSAWCSENRRMERKDGETETQFLYRTRKRTWGPFKEQLWNLDEKQTIVRDVEAELELLWRRLNVVGTRAVVEKYVTR
jgi:fructose/tagatose bisphosphate aldolase